MDRATMRSVLACLVFAVWSVVTQAGEGPTPVFEKPAPIGLAELTKRTTEGVSVVEGKDCANPESITGLK